MTVLAKTGLILSLWLVLIQCSLQTEDGDEARIFMGKPAQTGQIPWQVKLNIAKEGSNGFDCGGSLISERWVLTAAHCVENPDQGIKAVGSDVTIIAGSLRPDDQRDGQRTTGLKIIIHPEYVHDLLMNDIALIQLATPFQMNEQVQAIELGNDQVEVGSTVFASGWGKTERGIDPNLNYVDLKMISNDECAATYGGIFDGKMCTRGENGKNICNGDSGGPLVTYNGKPVLVGIVSAGDKYCSPGTLTIFTRVAYYRNWINENSGI